MKLIKLKKKFGYKKVTGCIIILSIFLFIIFGVYNNSYSAFSEEKHFNVVNGEVQDPGDIYFAYYVNDKITREFSKQNTGYTLDTEKSNCTNGVIATWDDDAWAVTLNYKNYNASEYTRTKCNLFFKSLTIRDFVTTLAKNDTTNLVTDDYNNVRYIGANPNNYISFDGDIWRIIGVMKNIDDGNGNKSDRVKIIRAESIGDYSWDTSESSINNGYGVNEWSQADIMKLLNPGYENETVGGSLYWNSKSGICYSGSNNSTKSCDFASIGVNDKLKNMIGDAVWNTGSFGTIDFSDEKYGLTKHFYIYERSINTGKKCTSGVNCNDTVERTTMWIGKIGLMYPSDFGYSTSGGTTTDRTTCLNTKLFARDNSKECYNKNNSWIYKDNMQWTLTAYPYFSTAMAVFHVHLDGDGLSYDAHNAHAITPVAYLKSSVKILSGDGSKANPFILGI